MTNERGTIYFTLITIAILAIFLAILRKNSKLYLSGCAWWEGFLQNDRCMPEAISQTRQVPKVAREKTGPREDYLVQL